MLLFRPSLPHSKAAFFISVANDSIPISYTIQHNRRVFKSPSRYISTLMKLWQELKNHNSLVMYNVQWKHEV